MSSLYLRQIGGRPLLTAAEEQRLARLIEAGRQARKQLERDPPVSEEVRRRLAATAAQGERAEQAFVESNLRLVVSIARRYLHAGLPLPDLVQEGNIGLLRAVERFDHHRGVRFSTFATWLIRQAIVRAIANNGRLVRLPVRAGEVIARVLATARDLEDSLGRAPSTAELAAALGMSVDRTEEALRHSRLPVSLSSPLRGAEDMELGETIGDGERSPLDAVVASFLSGEIRRLLAHASLNERERAVLVYRYGLDGGEPESFTAIGRRLDLAPDATRSVHRQALQKLRAVPGMPDRGRELLAG